MLWTEEAVEVLKRLAREGRSASVIALALGAPSRNAVIGKANRIGIRLNGDRRAPSPGSAPAGAHRPPSAVPRSRSASGEGLSARALPRDPRIERQDRKAPLTFAEAEVGDMRRVKPQDLRQFACRWPLGDPRSGDFAYCGLIPAEGRSYCAGHCRMAYRSPTARPSRPEQGWPQAPANAWRRWRPAGPLP
jgi:GcrA cell cycle regulator